MGGITAVDLTGKLSKCGVSSPRFDVQSESRKMAEQSALIPSVWFYCTDNLSQHHGPEKQDKNTEEGKSLDSFSRDVIHKNKMPQGWRGGTKESFKKWIYKYV